MQDLMSYISFKHCFGNGALQTSTQTGDSIDSTSVNGGNNGLCFAVDVGAITDGTHTITLEDSIDGGSSWNTVAAPYLQVPSGQSNVVTSATPAKTFLKFGYLGNANIASISASAGYPVSNPNGNKLLVRLKNTVSGSPSTGGYLTGFVGLGYPENLPAA